MGILGAKEPKVEGIEGQILIELTSVVRGRDSAPDALTFTRKDMCTERGGGTAIVFMILISLYVGARCWIYYKGRLNAGIVNPANPRGAEDTDAAKPLYNFINERGIFKKFMALVELIFVSPFVPMEVHSFVMWIFNWFFYLTIPMAVTRYYEKRWAHDVIALQGPFNMIAYAFGCKGLDLQAIPYTMKVESGPPALFSKPPSAESDKWGRIDHYFTFHLTIAVVWLTLGFVQIYKARNGGWSSNVEVNWKTHRIFGRITAISLCCHIIMMSFLIWENPVNQHLIICLGYWSKVWDSIQNLYVGIRHAMKKEKMQHRLYMVNTYIRSTMGSGSIRVTAWALWLIGHFFTPEKRILFDRGDCQTYAEEGIGDASGCWRPVFINLLFTDLFVTWLEMLFITMPGQIGLEKERILKKGELELQFIIIIPTLVLVWFDPTFDTNFADDSTTSKVIRNLAEFSALLWFFTVKISATFRRKVYDMPANDGSWQSSGVMLCKSALRVENEQEHAHED